MSKIFFLDQNLELRPHGAPLVLSNRIVDDFKRAKYL